jgi:hypothetical protein
MVVRAFHVLCAASWILLACGSEPEIEAPSSEGVAPEAGAVEREAASLAGMYRVSGFTVEKKSGDQRDISGTIILTQQGDRYSATFNLSTMFPTPDGPVKSDVIGKGEGAIEGRILRGAARTQIVAAGIPGVDPKFAFIPRTVSARLVSTTAGRIAEDGTLSVEIENKPAPGEGYAPTHTVLSGPRIPEAEGAGSVPDMGEPPA